ncbi:MAG: ligase-associated DNA damage response endonuclease PdeM [Flavobacteriaceae bacterium]
MPDISIAAPGTSALTVSGVPFHPLPSGALWWADERTLLVADLHLEKGSSFARRGALLPPYDTAATLAALARLISRLNPRLVVALGDSFHDPHAGDRLHGADVETIGALQAGREWVWISGNHDPQIPQGVGGMRAGEIRMGPLTLRHEPRPGAAPGEIAGHLHPCARIVSAGRTFRRRCFAGDGSRLVLPAFGAFTGGLNVLDVAFAGLFSAPLRIHAIGEKSVYLFGRRNLRPD